MPAVAHSAILCLCIALPVVSAEPDSGWDVFRRITTARSYTFLLRSRICVTGQIVSVSSQSLSVRQPSGPNPHEITIPLADVLRVSDGPRRDDVVYSGRSSWSDVRAIPKHSREHLLVVTKDKREHAGEPDIISESDLTILVRGQKVAIPKANILRVYYVRVKPASDRAVWAAQEMFVLDPALWPHLLHIEGRITVKLFDAALPEDESPVQCSTARSSFTAACSEDPVSHVPVR